MKQMQADIHYHGPVVVFDLDDTLFSEREHAIGAYRAVASLPEFATPWLSRRVAGVMTDALDRRENPFDALTAFLDECGVISLSSVKRLIGVYRDYSPRHLTLYPDAQELLDALRDRGIRVALITDGRSSTQRRKLKALGIADRFHPGDVIISEETGHDKSETDNFVAIVHHYPEASGFIYIGDNQSKDFLIPTLLGWQTFCLRDRGDNIHPQSEEHGDFEMIDRLTDILTFPLFSKQKNRI